MEAYQIFLIVLAIILVLLGIFLLVYFFGFASHRYKKQVSELTRKFEYLHALLFGQDAQYVKRIEMISLTNLLYVSVHMNFNKRFKDVRDKSDAIAQTTINNLKDLLGDKDFKSLKAFLLEAKAILSDYEQQVDSLNNDLIAVIKPEEDCRLQTLNLKEKLRAVKSEYYLKQADLSLAASSFNTTFDKLDEKFKSIDGLVESAKYDEAKTELPRIEALLNALSLALNELPELCANATSIIPDAIASLQNRYEDLRGEGYPLAHILTPNDIEGLRKQLNKVSESISRLDLKEVKKGLSDIKGAIEAALSAFNQEIDAKLSFDKKCDGCYRLASNVDQRYIKLCNALPSIKTIYVISPAHQGELDSIKELVNNFGATKRSLDALINGITRQPYTLLIKKMDTLNEEALSADSSIKAFDNYLSSLKEDSEEALKTIDIYQRAFFEGEALLNSFHHDALNEKYLPLLDTLYGYNDLIYTTLMKRPIDVELVVNTLAKLKEEGDNLLSSLKKDADLIYTCDGAIVYANRQRGNLSQVKDLLMQAETLYYQASFQDSYNAVSKAFSSESIS